MNLPFDHAHVDDLNCNCLIWVKGKGTGMVVTAFEDLAGIAFSDIIAQKVAVVLQLFTDCT